MKNNIKLRDNRGSALVLAILATALLSIIVVTISFQINNVLTKNKRSYDNMKEKYKAEAGIEKAIFEIENDIGNFSIKKNYNQKQINHHKHDNCPKVEFDELGNPVINQGNWSSGNGFARLIYYEIIHQKSTLAVQILESALEDMFGIDNAGIQDYYNKNIHDLAVSNIYTEFENNINSFINMMNVIEREVKNNQASDDKKDNVIKSIVEVRDYMLEIKCRLGILDSTDTEGGDVEESIFITIPYYDVSIDSDNNLNFSNIPSKPNKKVEIKIKVDKNNQIEDIDLTKLNENFLESQSGEYKIKADIDFIFTKASSGYEIKQKVNSYERIN